MENKFIKILDKKTADMLIKSGFSYLKEKTNNENVYVFIITDDLVNSLSQIITVNYVVENKLHF